MSLYHDVKKKAIISNITDTPILIKYSIQSVVSVIKDGPPSIGIFTLLSKDIAKTVLSPISNMQTNTITSLFINSFGFKGRRRKLLLLSLKINYCFYLRVALLHPG